MLARKTKPNRSKIPKDYYSNPIVIPPECDPLCIFRNCYAKGEDKGSYVVGRGYTGYYQPEPCCMTRLRQGCGDARIAITSEETVKALEFILEYLNGIKVPKRDRKKAFCAKMIEKLIKYYCVTNPACNP